MSLFYSSNQGLIVPAYGHGVWKVLGGMFTFMGTWAFIAATYKVKELEKLADMETAQMVFTAIGGSMILAGITFFFVQDFCRFDFGKQEFTQHKGIGGKRRARHSLSNVSSVMISKEDNPDTDSNHDYVYPVTLKRNDGDDLVVTKFADVEDALTVAQAIASRGGWKVFDAVLGDSKAFEYSPKGQKVKYKLVEFSSLNIDLKSLVWSIDARDSLAKLYTAAHKGGKYFKIEGAGSAVPAFIGAVWLAGLYFYLFQFGLLSGVSSLFGNGTELVQNGRLTADGFGFLLAVILFVLMVVAPFIAFGRRVFGVRPYELIVLMPTHLVCYAPVTFWRWEIKGMSKGQALQIPYDAVHGVSVKGIDSPRWLTRRNALSVRLDNKYIEIARGGVSLEQLEDMKVALSSHTAGT